MSGLAVVPGAQPVTGTAAGASADVPGAPAAHAKPRQAERNVHPFAQLLEQRAAAPIAGPPPGAGVPPVALAHAAAPPVHALGVSPPSARSSLQAALSALHQLAVQIHESETRVDTLLAAARRGRSLSATQLLALQAEVFRYSQAVEIVSRTTDRLIAGLKQALNTQV